MPKLWTFLFCSSSTVNVKPPVFRKGGLVSSFMHTIGTFSLEQGLRFLTSIEAIFSLDWTAGTGYSHGGLYRVGCSTCFSARTACKPAFWGGILQRQKTGHPQLTRVGEKNPLPCLETIINTKTSNDVSYKNTRHKRLKRHEIFSSDLFLRFRCSSCLTISFRFHPIRFRFRAFILYRIRIGHKL
jgi:hypothetical protein